MGGDLLIYIPCANVISSMHYDANIKIKIDYNAIWTNLFLFSSISCYKESHCA